MNRTHVAAVLFIVVALGIANFVYVLRQTSKHHVNVEHHPVFRALFVRSTRLLPSADKTCGVGWEYRADEDRCVRALARGVDSRFLRESKGACDDFYDNSCGSFNADPSNAGDASLFAYVQRLNNENLEELITSADGNVRQFYASCTQRKLTRAEELSSSRTLRALLGALSTISLTSYDELAVFWGYLQRYDTILPLELTLELDPWQTTRLVPSLHWSGVSTAESAAEVAARLSLIYPPSTARTWADYVVRMERDLIEAAGEQPTTTFFAYLRRGRADFIDEWATITSDARFNISRFVQACAPDDRDWLGELRRRPLWTASADYLQRLPGVIERYTPETWAVYTKHAILYHLDNARVPKLAYHRLYDAQHALPWTRPRFAASANASCVQLTHAFMPHTIDRLYASRYFTDAVRERAENVSVAVHEHFTDRLSGALRDKIAALRLEVGVPLDLPSSPLVLREDASYIDNVMAERRYHIETNFKQLYHETLPLWIFSDGLATSTAAFYQHQLNGLTVSAGMLQPPLFSPNFTDAVLFSRLGVFVAHEMAHAIDRTGLLFDATGSYIGGETQQYTESEQCLIAQYSEVTALGNTHNGVQTLNENFADTLGMQIAYGAFMETPRSEEEQRDFFRSYAQLFCRAPLNSAQEQASIATSRHSLPSLRVNNVVSSVHGFNEMWSCKNSARDFCSLLN